MKKFSAVISVLALTGSLVACKGLKSQGGSEAKDSTPGAADGPGMADEPFVASASHVKPRPLAVTFVDPVKNVPVMANYEFMNRKPELTLTYRVQRPNEPIMQVVVVADEVECSVASCIYSNSVENISLYTNDSGGITAMTWHGKEVAGIEMKEGEIDLKSIDCDMATGMGCFP
jgi:hypothetical protein